MAKGWVRALGTHRGPRHAGSSWRQQPSLPPPAMVPRVTALYSCPPPLPPEQDGLPGLGISQLLVVKKRSLGSTGEDCTSQLWEPRGWGTQQLGSSTV